MNAPACEGVRSLKVELVAAFDEALTVAPLVYTILEVRVEDLHRVRDEHAALGVR